METFYQTDTGIVRDHNEDSVIALTNEDGATLMAAKILIKKSNLLLGFNLMDITPLSLGVEVVNEDKNEEIRKEGGIMSVIIERGETIPCTKIKKYITVEDNQTSVPIVIYEGKKKYVKEKLINFLQKLSIYIFLKNS